ncbi:MAG: RagB/SusD family nutrient uptake outer membrane protein, partial [Ferruginibacter sp.]
NCDAMGPMTGVGAPAIATGYDVLVPSLSVFNSWNSRDYRKAVSFDTAVLFAGNVLKDYTQWPIPRPHIAKFTRYPGKDASYDGSNSSLNYMLMRYAEVLLIAAEASAEVNNGPTAEAIGYVNQVRARARNWAGNITSYPADVTAGLSKDAFIDLVLEERRFELAFEFKRWYDIKRRKLGEKVFKGSNSLEPHTNFDASRDYLFPIPASELDINPNLQPQNPGY